MFSFRMISQNLKQFAGFDQYLINTFFIKFRPSRALYVHVSQLTCFANLYLTSFLAVKGIALEYIRRIFYLILANILKEFDQNVFFFIKMVKNIFPGLVIYQMISFSYIFIFSPFSIANLGGLGPFKVLFFCAGNGTRPISRR